MLKYGLSLSKEILHQRNIAAPNDEIMRVSKKCYYDSLKQTFTVEEMRILFIQPTGMDKSHYSKKVTKMINEGELC
jgi:hypothetical protein